MLDTKIAALVGRLDAIRQGVGQLARFDKKVREIATMSPAKAGLYMQDFLEAQDLAGTFLSQAVRYELEAKKLVDEAEAIAFIDKAAAYLLSNKVRDSAEARKKYIPLDAGVQKAQDTHARATAQAVLLKNKLNLYRQAKDDVKKLVYGQEAHGIT